MCSAVGSGNNKRCHALKHIPRRIRMSDKSVVLRSISIQAEGRCVDLFMRPDGTFGFEEFRRDVEDHRGWFPVGFFGDRIFESEEDALLEARSKVSWLNDAMS